MGMTDRQFDTYQQSLLRDLDRIEEEMKDIAEGKIKTSASLEKLKRHIEEQLKRP